MPTLLALLPGVPRTEVIKGPTVLCLGDFVATRTLRGKPLEDVGGLLHRFGMDDVSTGELLLEIAEDRAFTDFTVAYFADNDYRSHEVGPEKAIPVIQAVDTALARMFDAAGGMDRFLEETFVVVTSDHGHCEIADDAERGTIYLDQEVGDLQIAALGAPWADSADILICPNMRATQIYFHEPTPANISKVVSRVLQDARVDHAFWATGTSPAGTPGYAAVSSDGRLDFWRGGQGGDGSGRDAYGTIWGWLGDLSVLDATLERRCPRSGAFTRMPSSGSPARSTRRTAARCGSPRSRAPNSKCPAARRTSPAPRTARSTRSSRGARSSSPDRAPSPCRRPCDPSISRRSVSTSWASRRT